MTLRCCLRELGGLPWHVFDLAMLVGKLRSYDDLLEDMSAREARELEERVDAQMAHLESIAAHQRETRRWRQSREIRSERLC